MLATFYAVYGLAALISMIVKRENAPLLAVIVSLFSAVFGACLVCSVSQWARWRVECCRACRALLSLLRLASPRVPSTRIARFVLSSSLHTAAPRCVVFPSVSLCRANRRVRGRAARVHQKGELCVLGE